MDTLTLLIILNVLVQIVDVVTTNGALNNGAREANPIVAKMMDIFGELWWIPKLLVAGCALYVASLFPSDGVVIALVLLAIWYLNIVRNNYKLWKG